MVYKVLAIDDDIEITDFLKMILSVEGYEVHTAENGMSALERCKSEKFDIILMDLGLPDIEGRSLCKIVRKDIDTPIIIISAKDSVSDKVLCLEYGADDYITKPFESIELIARIKAILRRFNKKTSKLNEFKAFGLTIDTKNQIAMKGDNQVNFTPKEYELVIYLANNRDSIVERDKIITDLWGKHNLYSWSRSLDVHIQHIRQKIENNPKKPEFIQTVSGVGYKIAK